MECGFACALPVAVEGPGVVGVALEHGETRFGAIAFVVEVFVVAAVAEHAARGGNQTQAEAELALFAVAKAVVGEGERRVFERYLVAFAGQAQALVEVLEVDAGRQ